MTQNNDDINEIKRDEEATKAYNLALKRIARKDYTTFELKEYLHGKVEDIEPGMLDKVIKVLEKRHLLDDERYLMDRIDYLRSRYRGNHRIIEDLKKRGFKENEVAKELSKENFQDYIDRGTIRANDFLKRQRKGSFKQRHDKTKQHLLRQGFDFESINHILEQVNDKYTKKDEKESLIVLIEKTRKKYLRRYEENEVYDRLVKHTLSKGYKYDMIKQVLKEYKNEN